MITNLNIKFDSDSKRVEINGPLDDTMVMLGLLEMAKLTLIERRFKHSNVIDTGNKNAK